jgi:hypothetical protein
MKEKDLDKRFGTPERFDQTRRHEESAERPELNVDNRKSPDTSRPFQPVEYDKPADDTKPGKREW